MNTKIFILITLSCLFLFSCNNQNKSESNSKAIKTDSTYDDSLTIEQNFAKHAVAFDNDSTFPFLDELAKTRSVIFLGEGGHGDSITKSIIKPKMIDYLLKKGMNSVAYEGLSFITAYVYSNPKYDDFTKQWLSSGIQKDIFTPGLSTNTNVLNYNKENHIKTWGIDIYDNIFEIDAVHAILSSYEKSKPSYIDWVNLKYWYNRKFAYKNKISVNDQYQMMRIIDSISNYVMYQISLNGDKTELEAVLQWIRNVNTNFSYNQLDEDKLKPTENPDDFKKTIFPFRNRDYQMAENILWIVRHCPEEKLVIDLANYHAAKDISQTKYPTDSLLYFINQCAGETVYNELRGKMYSLACTSLNRINGPDVKPGLLETAIAEQNHNAPFAFLDFEPLRYKDGFRDKEFDAAMINKKMGKWQYIFDGIYYIRDEKIYQWYEEP